MTTPQVAQDSTNYQLLKLYVDTISNYDGITSGIFWHCCKTLTATFSTPTDKTINKFILRAILTKLADRALNRTGSRIELRTWDEIKPIKFWWLKKFRLLRTRLNHVKPTKKKRISLQFCYSLSRFKSKFK